MAGFTDLRWQQINNKLAANPSRFGMPIRRSGSVVIGSFNALKLGKATNDAKRWDFLERFISKFDLLALQEVTDDLAGLRRLQDMLGSSFKVLVSDTTGAAPGSRGLRERLAFLYKPSRIELLELASDISYDRSFVTERLRADIDTWKQFFDEIDNTNAQRIAEGKKARSLSEFEQPVFLTFIRTPHCASFAIRGANGAKPVQFLAVNAHMLYGAGRDERKREFFALLEWIVNRVKSAKRMYFKNMVLLADLNMEFDDANTQMSDIIRRMIELESSLISGQNSARANFPFLAVHPSETTLFHTNARRTETFDHVAFFIDRHERGLPLATDNPQAGRNGLNGYDYGVFNFVELFAQALHESSFEALSAADRKDLLSRAKSDVSDHMPVWVRIPIPGA